MRQRHTIFLAMQDRMHRETDRVFLWLLIGQLFAIVLALAISPFSDEGGKRQSAR